MVAARDIRAGEVIFEETPVVVGPDQQGLPICLSCYSKVRELGVSPTALAVSCCVPLSSRFPLVRRSGRSVLLVPRLLLPVLRRRVRLRPRPPRRGVRHPRQHQGQDKELLRTIRTRHHQLRRLPHRPAVAIRPPSGFEPGRLFADQSLHGS